MIKGNFKRKTLNWGLVSSFRDFTHYHHGGEYGGMQALEQ